MILSEISWYYHYDQICNSFSIHHYEYNVVPRLMSWPDYIITNQAVTISILGRFLLHAVLLVTQHSFVAIWQVVETTSWSALLVHDGESNIFTRSQGHNKDWSATRQLVWGTSSTRCSRRHCIPTPTYLQPISCNNEWNVWWWVWLNSHLLLHNNSG